MGLSYIALRNKFNSRPLVKPEDNLPPITGPTTGEASVNANAIPVPQRGSPVPVMDNSSMKVYKPDMQQVPGSMPNTQPSYGVTPGINIPMTQPSWSLTPTQVMDRIPPMTAEQFLAKSVADTQEPDLTLGETQTPVVATPAELAQKDLYTKYSDWLNNPFKNISGAIGKFEVEPNILTYASMDKQGNIKYDNGNNNLSLLGSLAKGFSEGYDSQFNDPAKVALLADLEKTRNARIKDEADKSEMIQKAADAKLAAIDKSTLERLDKLDQKQTTISAAFGTEQSIKDSNMILKPSQDFASTSNLYNKGYITKENQTPEQKAEGKEPGTFDRDIVGENTDRTLLMYALQVVRPGARVSNNGTVEGGTSISSKADMLAELIKGSYTTAGSRLTRDDINQLSEIVRNASKNAVDSYNETYNQYKTRVKEQGLPEERTYATIGNPLRLEFVTIGEPATTKEAPKTQTLNIPGKTHFPDSAAITGLTQERQEVKAQAGVNTEIKHNTKGSPEKTPSKYTNPKEGDINTKTNRIFTKGEWVNL